MNKTVIMLTVMFIIAGSAMYGQEAHFTELNGTVEVRAAGTQDWQPAEVGGAVGRDSVVSTGIRSSAVITLGGSTIAISPLTVLTLEELVQRDGAEETALFLRTGRVRADVTPPAGLQADFTVRSPTTTASVRGTSFSFNGRRLSVRSGRVDLVNNSGQKVTVGANQRSFSDSGSHGWLSSPFEVDTMAFSPSFTDLDNTGSGGEPPAQASGTPGTTIIIDWP